MKSLADLYDHMLRDVYHAEKQVLKQLPKLTRAVTDADLKSLLEAEKAGVATRIETLEAGFEALDKRPRGIPCEAMIGLIEEASEVLEDAEDEAINAGVLAAYQAIKHYEITRFGTLGAWANRLGDLTMAARFGETVDEAKALDERMSELAERKVNADADLGDGAEQPTGGKPEAKKPVAKPAAKNAAQPKPVSKR
ncbi:ferritin-like domain-containing protein [Brevundimonas sp.]|uniref:YciE/YciF ferroxidase family protein n=1 Tax=Brevundimonas sp. TaxID=1871086 RepID=UPI002AB9BF73|nr:ferritin-like domain-containing protein [Brevundimonas sp.]MDZ4362575.1 ferritin-like domain-containing protein [Brevundimonas sp.]